MFSWLQDVTTWDMDTGLQGGTASEIIIPITELERSEMRSVTGGQDSQLWSGQYQPGSLAPSSGSLASSYVVSIDITTTEQVSS